MKTLTHHPLTALLGALALGAACEAARAVDYHAATVQDLQTALTLAAGSSGSNNIYVTNGYYLGNFNFNSTNVNNLTLLAEPGVANTQITIDSGGIGSSLNISGTATAKITVQGMTFLRNCNSTALGGLQIAGGNTTILVSGCRFLSPTNSSGMGLNISRGLNATVTNCTAAGNPSGGGGAGIYIVGITNLVTVQNCTAITNNCGGIQVSGANVVAISGNLLAGNSGVNSATVANGNGAGVFCSGTTIALSGNTLTGNSANNFSVGGGAYCTGTTLTLTGNTFTGNSAITGGQYGAGGGAYCSGTSITLSGNTFAGNSAVPSGGGAACTGGIVMLSNNSFTGNSANTGGGAPLTHGEKTPGGSE